MPANPHPVGSLKFMIIILPVVTPATLKPFADFHNIIFSPDVGKDTLHNLSVQHSVYTFAVILVDNNRVKILHSTGWSVAPLSGESV